MIIRIFGATVARLPHRPGVSTHAQAVGNSTKPMTEKTSHHAPKESGFMYFIPIPHEPPKKPATMINKNAKNNPSIIILFYCVTVILRTLADFEDPYSFLL